MKKFAKVNGCFLTDGNFNKVKVTKSYAISRAKASSKRLGMDKCGMQYSVTETDEFFSVMTHTGVKPAL